jgi:hypothetical protein
MRKALHPYVVAAVAVVGASTLALTPVIATPPDIKIVNPEVRPTASPFDVYRDAVEHVLANLEALLGAALAGPELTGLNLEVVLDGIIGDPTIDFTNLRDSLERNIDDLPALLESTRSRISGAMETALVNLAAGRLDLAVDQLLSASVDAVLHVVDLATTSVSPLLGDLKEPVTRLQSDLTVALLGPVVNGIGTTAQSLQGVVAALKSGEPDRVLNAVVSAPAVITDRVLNGGYTTVSGAVLGDQAWPGVLNNRLSAPIADVVGSERTVTLDVAALDPSVSPERQPGEVQRDVQDADKGTNKDVMATDGAIEAPDDNGPRPRPFGSNFTGRTGGRAGMNTLRDGIRDGIEGFREGVRNVVRTVTGRTDTHDDGSAGGAAESP